MARTSACTQHVLSEWNPGDRSPLCFQHTDGAPSPGREFHPVPSTAGPFTTTDPHLRRMHVALAAARAAASKHVVATESSNPARGLISRGNTKGKVVLKIARHPSHQLCDLDPKRPGVRSDTYFMAMHPDLVALLAQYNTIVDAQESGSMSYEQAVASLNNLVAIDGDGWSWHVDPDSGRLVKSRPNDAAREADPSEYVPSQIPSRGPDLSTPPRVTPPTLSRPAAPPFSPTSAPPFSTTSAPPFSGDPATGPSHLTSPYSYDQHEEFNPASAKRARGGPPSMPSFALPPFFAQHRRSLIIVAVLVVLLVVIIAKGHTTTPPATATTLSTVATTTTTVPQSIGAIPSDAQISAVFNDMSSGSLAEARQATLRQLPIFPLTNNVALYFGYHDMGYFLQLHAEPRRIHGNVTSTLFIENSSNYVLARASITWVATDGQWHLLAWPRLIPSR